MVSRLTVAFALAFISAALTMPAFAQQEKGDKEVALNGFVDVPHSDPSSVLGDVTVRLGYYIKPNTLIGIDSTTFIQKSGQDEFVDVFYRHLFHTHSGKLYPFLGASAGENLLHDGGTNSNLLAKGEVGLKFYLSRRFAFETAYNFQYVHVPGQSFSESSDSVIVFGFSYLFGGRKR